MSGKPFQFGLSTILAVVLLVALACSTVQLNNGLQLVALLGLGPLAAALIGPKTVVGSTISGGVGGAIGLLLVMVSPLVQSNPRVDNFVVGSVCFMSFGFLLGSAMGATVGLLRECSEENKTAAAAMKPLKERDDEGSE